MPTYPECKADLTKLFNECCSARLHITQDMGYFYAGNIYLRKSGVAFNVVDHLVARRRFTTANNIDQEIVVGAVRTPSPSRHVNIDPELVTAEPANMSDHHTNIVANVPPRDKEVPNASPSLPADREGGEAAVPSDSDSDSELVDVEEDTSLEISKSIGKVTFIEGKFNLK